METIIYLFLTAFEATVRYLSGFIPTTPWEILLFCGILYLILKPYYEK